MLSLADRVVEEALTWVGVPYRDKGRSRTDGVDCAGLIVKVAHAVGYTDYDSRRYTTRPNVADFLRELRGHLDEIPMSELGHGDVLVLRGPRLPVHCGIVEVDPRGNEWLIHAYRPVGQVIRTSLVPYSRMRVRAFRHRRS